jgi:hypothetical protein
LLAPCGPSAADDKKDDKDKPAPSGAWAQQEGQLKIDFSGKVKITDFEGTKKEAKEKVKERLPAGTEFEFPWKVQGRTATLSGVEGGGDSGELLRSRLEGKYDQKK